MLTDEDLRWLIADVICQRHHHPSYLPPHLAKLKQKDPHLAILEDQFRAKSPPLNYERGAFPICRGLFDSLKMSRPMTLAVTIKLMDPSYVRHVQRYLGYRITGNVRDLYKKYAKQHRVQQYCDVDRKLTDGCRLRRKTGVVSMTCKVESWAHMTAAMLYYGQSSFPLQSSILMETSDKIEVYLAPFLKSDSKHCRRVAKIVVGWGSVPYVEWFLEMSSSGYHLHELVFIHVLYYVCKTHRIAYFKAVMKFIENRFRVSPLSNYVLIRIVEFAAMTGNVPFTEQIIKIVKTQCFRPRLVLWMGLFFGSIHRHDFINMFRYFKLIHTHHPDSLDLLRKGELKPHTKRKTESSLVLFYMRMILLKCKPDWRLIDAKYTRR